MTLGKPNNISCFRVDTSLYETKMLKKKLNQCQYAFQTYGHLLNEIKDCLRSGEFNSQEFYKMQLTDDFILDNSPIIDKWVKKYDKLFTF